MTCGDNVVDGCVLLIFPPRVDLVLYKLFRAACLDDDSEDDLLFLDDGLHEKERLLLQA